ncbi:hypothetical protein ACHAQA_009265 [Verticillium albo-atrum]
MRGYSGLDGSGSSDAAVVVGVPCTGSGASSPLSVDVMNVVRSEAGSHVAVRGVSSALLGGLPRGLGVDLRVSIVTEADSSESTSDTEPAEDAAVFRSVDEVRFRQCGCGVSVQLVVELRGSVALVADDPSDEDATPAREADSSAGGAGVTVLVIISVTVPFVTVTVTHGEVDAAPAVALAPDPEGPTEASVPETPPDSMLPVVPAASVEFGKTMVLSGAAGGVGAAVEVLLAGTGHSGVTLAPDDVGCVCVFVVAFPVLTALAVVVALKDATGDDEGSSPWKSVLVSSASSEVELPSTVLFDEGNSGVAVGTGTGVVTLVPDKVVTGRIVKFPGPVGMPEPVALGHGNDVVPTVPPVLTPVPAIEPDQVAFGSGNGVRFEGVGKPTPVVDVLVDAELVPVPAMEPGRVALGSGKGVDSAGRGNGTIEVGAVVFAGPAMVPEKVTLGRGVGVPAGGNGNGALDFGMALSAEPKPVPAMVPDAVAFGSGNGADQPGGLGTGVNVGVPEINVGKTDDVVFSGGNGTERGAGAVDGFSAVLAPPVGAEAVTFGSGKGVAGGGRELGAAATLVGDDGALAAVPVPCAVQVALDMLKGGPVGLDGEGGAVGMVTVPGMTMTVVFRLGKGGADDTVRDPETTLAPLVAFVGGRGAELEPVTLPDGPGVPVTDAEEPNTNADELSSAQPGRIVGLSVALADPEGQLAVAFVCGNGPAPGAVDVTTLPVALKLGLAVAVWDVPVMEPPAKRVVEVPLNVKGEPDPVETAEVEMVLLGGYEEETPEDVAADTDALEGVAVQVGKLEGVNTGGESTPGVPDPSGLELPAVELTNGGDAALPEDTPEGASVTEPTGVEEACSGRPISEDTPDRAGSDAETDADAEEEDSGGYVPSAVEVVAPDVSGGYAPPDDEALAELSGG